MPVLNNPSPYDNLETVLTLARTIIADVMPTVAGDLLSDAQPYTINYVNLGWRKLQKKLALAGHQKLEQELDIVNLPVVATIDPAIQVSITWTGFFDGANQWQTPALPTDMIYPMRLWERQSGTVQRFKPMTPAIDALPSRAQGVWMQHWDWRDDTLWMPGSIVNLDLRMRYACYLPDLAYGQGGAQGTPVPVMRCAEALAYYIAEAFTEPRGDAGSSNPISQMFAAKGDVATDQITAMTAKTQQRANYRRIPYGGRRTSRHW